MLYFLFLNMNIQAQNNLSLELNWISASKSSVWNRVNSTLKSNDLGVLINYTLGKQTNQILTSGIMLSSFSISDSNYIYNENINQIVFDNITIRYYDVVIPLYYSILIKNFYLQTGFNGKRLSASRLYIGRELAKKNIVDSAFYLEYHFGTGFRYIHNNWGVKIGLNADINIQRTYYDYGVDIGLIYQFNKK